jgi:exosortase
VTAVTPPLSIPRADAADASARPVLGLFTQTGAVMAGLLGGAFIGLYFRWFLLQHAHSKAAPEDWGHAYLVPLISGYLLWQRREAIERVRAEAFWPGLCPMLLGIVSYFFLVSTRFPGGHMVQGWALLLTLVGVVLLLTGPRMLGLVFLPIAFLVFGITVSEAVMIRATAELQLLASSGAWVVLSAIGLVSGFGCDAAGNVLTLTTPSGDALPPLNVAEACSGMRMLVAFFALAGATALLSCRFWWQRAALLLLAGPVALVLNIARVAVLGLLTLSDPNLSQGGAHKVIGMILLVPGLGLFLLVVWALNRAVKPDPRGAVA